MTRPVERRFDLIEIGSIFYENGASYQKHDDRRAVLVASPDSESTQVGKLFIFYTSDRVLVDDEPSGT